MGLVKDHYPFLSTRPAGRYAQVDCHKIVEECERILAIPYFVTDIEVL